MSVCVCVCVFACFILDELFVTEEHPFLLSYIRITF